MKDPTTHNGNAAISDTAASPNTPAKKYRLDVIVIASILVVSALFALTTLITRTEGAYVEIAQNGNIIGKYPLDLDRVYTLNGGTNILTVKNGEAYMSYSSCPDHTCENTGKISYVGQTIICLPNRISITVVGESDNYVDFVS